ncbi:MAG: 1-acyl-sn-glycerol-3-phosphate acyltransferase [Gammaproteobacteria bacterium]|nr:1-acyl-sn-glycerol-3-phosphate acyltransferase [Gammaproteobacteria bacterium]MDE0271643.1 1-acyl-sn-glycerol-3-phosphate acyltransferase [Gammaproteobacteria bacterium]
MPHIVDVLIEERAEKLRQRPFVWRLVRTFLYPLIAYPRAVALIDRVQPMSGQEIFDHLSDMLRLRMETHGLAWLPATGRALVTPNHPAGIADGIALYDAIKQVRRDVVFFANRDAVRAAPNLVDSVIPVEWVEERRGHARNKETVRHMVRAFREDRLVVIFPSGRLARPSFRGLIEREWTPTAVSLARKYACPIVPAHIKARNSWFYYLLYAVNTELKDMTLFRELINKQRWKYRIRFGPGIDAGGNSDPAQLAAELRSFVTGPLAQGPAHFPAQSNRR